MKTPALYSFLLLSLTVGGCDPHSDGGDRALTYNEYASDGRDTLLDPVGASEIYHRSYQTRDGYDVWWRFVIANDDQKKLISNVADARKGPQKLEWNSNTSYPENWKPHSTPPKWWNPDVGANAKSIHWCHSAGNAKRHHGWYFLYDPDSKIMVCWHWNHQWSSNECTHSTP